MGLGAAATLRLIGALLRFISDLFLTVADAAGLAGDPEISTGCAVIAVALFASGHYSKSLVSILILTFIDLLVKEFGPFPVLGN